VAQQNPRTPRTQQNKDERLLDLQADLKLLRTLQKLSRTSWSPTLRANAADISSAAQQVAAAVSSNARKAKYYSQGSRS
jgi:hypothetical protein